MIPVSDWQRRKVWLSVRIKSISDSCFTKPRNMADRSSVSATSRPQTPKICFRVLTIGRANAGKTSILQRICDTTESPFIYARVYDDKGGYYEGTVSILTVLYQCHWFHSPKARLNPSIDVSHTCTSLRPLLIHELAWRAQHRASV